MTIDREGYGIRITDSAGGAVDLTPWEVLVLIDWVWDQRGKSLGPGWRSYQQRLGEPAAQREKEE